MRSLIFTLAMVAGVASSAFAASGMGYVVEVDGRPVDVLEIPKPVHHVNVLKENAQPYAYAQFDTDKEVTVRVRTGVDIVNEQTLFLPLSAGVKPLRRGPREVVFCMKPGMRLVFEPQGRLRALVIAANRPETDIPNRNDPNVVWVGPGRHRRNIRLTSGQTLYLAPGAIVEGNLLAVGTNMVIRGRGRFDGSCWGHYKGPGWTMVRVMGRNIVVRDIVFVSAWSWNLVIDKAENVTVDNVKILGGHVLNDDGIDICHSRNVVVRDSFIRAQDDCIAVKYSGENLLAERCVLWTDAACAVRIGFECVKGKSFSRIAFRDIDVAHLSVVRRPTSDFWSNCAVYVEPGNETTMSDILFDRIRFDAPERGDILLKVLTVKVKMEKYEQHEKTGRLDGLTFRDIAIRNPPPDSMYVHIEQFPGDPLIENIVFENVAPHGPHTLVNAKGPVMRDKKKGVFK